MSDERVDGVSSEPGAGEGIPRPGSGDGSAGPGDPSPAGTPPNDEGALAGAEAEGANGQEAEAVEQDLDQLMAKARERDEYLSLAQRTQADFENYRKRAAKDIAAAEGRGVAKLTMELLRALDNLDVAVANIQPQDQEDHYARSLRLAQMELLSALEQLGVEHYWPLGESFDPQRHEAMAQREFPGIEPGGVAEVYQRGYAVNGTVLRPARVVVAQ